jgi:hypothetical protein
MIENRSVPTNTVLPHVIYRDVEQAVAWLTKTFGFAEHYRYGEPGGPVNGAQLIWAARGSWSIGREQDGGAPRNWAVERRA